MHNSTQAPSVFLPGVGTLSSSVLHTMLHTHRSTRGPELLPAVSTPDLWDAGAGMELRRVRNLRGLKASQVARMGGHHGLARLLSDTRNDRRRRTRPAQLSPDALLAILVQVRDLGSRLDSPQMPSLQPWY